MEHIVQFAIGIDDKAIQNRIEEYAYKDVLDKIVKETMDTVFAHTNAYSRENMCKTMMEDALQSFLEERKDEIIGVFVCIFDHDDKNDKSSKE